MGAETEIATDGVSAGCYELEARAIRSRICNAVGDIMGTRPGLEAIWDAMNIKVCGFA